MKKFIFTAIFVLMVTVSASAQTDVDVANARLVKTLDLLEKTETALASERKVNALQAATISNMEKLDVLRVQTIEAKDAEIKELRRLKCSKTSILFLIRWTRCE